jgi:hypothetical protein
MTRKTHVRAHQRRNGSKVRAHERRVREDERDEYLKPVVHGVVAVAVIDTAAKVMRE